MRGLGRPDYDLAPAYFRPDSPTHQLFDGMKTKEFWPGGDSIVQLCGDVHMRVTGRCHLDFSSAWSLPQPVQRCSSPISPGPRGSISSTKTPQLPTSTCWKPWEEA